MGGLELNGNWMELKAELARREDSLLLTQWPALKPIEKAAFFKLLPRERALDFFGKLEFPEQFFLLGALPLGTLAPLLEEAPEDARALFHQLAPADVEALLRSVKPETACSK